MLALPLVIDARYPGEGLDQMGNWVFKCPNYGTGTIKDGYVAPWHYYKANAAFIVEACNAHASMLAENARLRAALERVLTDHLNNGEFDRSEWVCNLRKVARSALSAITA